MTTTRLGEAMPFEGKPKALGVFLSPGANPENHKAVIETPVAKLWFVGVCDSEEAAKVCRKMMDEEGLWLIGLSGEWKLPDIARIAGEFGDRVPVSVTWFPHLDKVSEKTTRSRIASIFHCAGGDPRKQAAVIDMPRHKIWLIGVEEFEDGVTAAKKLVDQEGVNVIELCGAWGYAGAAKVKEVVGESVQVGVAIHQYNDALIMAELLDKEKEHHHGIVPRPS